MKGCHFDAVDGDLSPHDRLELVRFRYFMRTIGTTAPGPIAAREERMPERRPLQELWLERYVTGKLARGLRA